MITKTNLQAWMILAAMGAANAHLVSVVAPAEGATVKAGTEVTISWKVQFAHSHKYDFSLSTDGGTTWTKFDHNVTVSDANGATATHKWTPAAAAEDAMIRICQKGDGAAAADQECNDNTKPAAGAPYMLETGMFTIDPAGTGVLTQGRPAASSLRFDARTRNLEVSLDLAGAEHVLLQAFDTRGRMVATLIDGMQPAGQRNLSIFSNRLQGAFPLVFKLQVGNQVKVQPYEGTR